MDPKGIDLIQNNVDYISKNGEVSLTTVTFSFLNVENNIIVQQHVPVCEPRRKRNKPSSHSKQNSWLVDDVVLIVGSIAGSNFPRGK